MHPRSAATIVAAVLIAGACNASQVAIDPPTSTVTPLGTLAPLVSTTIASVRTTTTTHVPIDTPRTRLVVNGTGDVNLDPTFVRTFPTTGYEDAWTGLFGAFERDDLTIINLECSPSELGTPWLKSWNFRCDVDALPSMASAGVDVANLANNHAMDYGFDAMLDGRQNLIDVGIAPVGTGANLVEAYEPAVMEINGWTIAVIGSGGVNPESGSWLALTDRPGMTHGDNTESIGIAIARAKQTADLVFVTAHWGGAGNHETAEFRTETG